MQLKLFVIPIKNVSEAEAEMNGFLRGHRVLAVKFDRILASYETARCAQRNNNPPTNANNNSGFRAVLPPAQPGSRKTPRLTRPPFRPRTLWSAAKTRNNQGPV